MDVTKKTYEAPEMEVVEIEQADIICTSNEQLTEDNFVW